MSSSHCPGPRSCPHCADLVLVLPAPVILVVSSCPGPCHPCHVVLSWSLSSSSHHPGPHSCSHSHPHCVDLVLVLPIPIVLIASSCHGPCHPCHVVLSRSLSSSSHCPGPHSHSCPRRVDLVLVLVVPITLSCPGPCRPHCVVLVPVPIPVPVILIVSSCPGPCCPCHVVLALLLLLSPLWCLSHHPCHSSSHSLPTL